MASYRTPVGYVAAAGIAALVSCKHAPVHTAPNGLETKLSSASFRETTPAPMNLDAFFRDLQVLEEMTSQYGDDLGRCVKALEFTLILEHVRSADRIAELVMYSFVPPVPRHDNKEFQDELRQNWSRLCFPNPGAYFGFYLKSKLMDGEYFLVVDERTAVDQTLGRFESRYDFQRRGLAAAYTPTPVGRRFSADKRFVDLIHRFVDLLPGIEEPVRKEDTEYREESISCGGY